MRCTPLCAGDHTPGGFGLAGLGAMGLSASPARYINNTKNSEWKPGFLLGHPRKLCLIQGTSKQSMLVAALQDPSDSATFLPSGASGPSGPSGNVIWVRDRMDYELWSATMKLDDWIPSDDEEDNDEETP